MEYRDIKLVDCVIQYEIVIFLCKLLNLRVEKNVETYFQVLLLLIIVIICNII